MVAILAGDQIGQRIQMMNAIDECLLAGRAMIEIGPIPWKIDLPGFGPEYQAEGLQ